MSRSFPCCDLGLEARIFQNSDVCLAYLLRAWTNALRSGLCGLRGVSFGAPPWTLDECVGSLDLKVKDGLKS